MAFNESLKDLMDEQLLDEPHVNVIGKTEFNERVAVVFSKLYDILSKSFGPGGAGTFVSVYPSYYNTKDGFSIMKHIAFDKKLDMAICNIVNDICNRLNFTVGDGTTTAVIATESTYQKYMENKDWFDNNHILPRDIMEKMEELKNTILIELEKEAVSIRSDDPEILKQNIAKVVYVSSNGNKELTEMISNLYAKLLYPAISCTISKEGITKSSIIDGYKIDVCLTDKLYINNDNNTMNLNNADALVFDHTVTKETYERLLKPLNEACRKRGRHLVCIAPFYDEKALEGVIATDLNREYRNNKDINLVLTVCNKTNKHAKLLLSDLAMLLNTPIINTTLEKEILEKTNTTQIDLIMNLDSREIPNISVAIPTEDNKLYLDKWNENIKNTFGYGMVDETIRVGYSETMEIGLKESIFSGFYYDKSLYHKHFNEAEENMKLSQRQAEANGTFSFDLVQNQQRFYSLGLKTGIIEVGASSEITQGYLKDTVDDAIKAAASAFNNGVVLGCNVSLIRVVDKIYQSTENNIEKKLLEIIREGFKDVYKTVLENVFEDMQYKNNDLGTQAALNSNKFIEFLHTKTKYAHYEPVAINVLDYFSHVKENAPNYIHDTIIDYSIFANEVFNLETGNFERDIINSAETDKEILKAVVDLLSLLITGNQLVMA